MTKTTTELKPLIVVEDDPGLQSQLKWSFDGYEVHVAGDRNTAINLLRKTNAPVITLDLGLPPDPTNASEGFIALQEILNLQPQTKVIVVTGNDDRTNALKAIEMGAYDFYQKPIDPDVLKIIIERAFHLHTLEEENLTLNASQDNSPLNGVIANSPEMLEVCRVIEKISPTDITALLLGESGTGKEVLARAIHGLSDRRDDRFVAINCASIPENLLESELYGYEKGAFTGASKRTIGKIETANGGTLFLDEIGDMPMGLQAKLLRFLQERVIERIGGRDEIPVDVRVVCATNQDLEEKIKLGEFREDLFYRISEITVDIPPLRERVGDTVLLAWSFLKKYDDLGSSRLTGFTNEALRSIEEYNWPGNVRELENRIKRAVIMADGQVVTLDALQLNSESTNTMPLNLREVREKAEASAVLRAMNYVGGNVSRAAELLGVSRPTLYDLVNKYGLK
ncbi:MAG: PEP-CTERM-box response regulator transcription factor [Candidatus Thiodiazotropha sp. (ex Notomyrtea botanica)]|nr:PEP-CTERM-box response regulator transcription factor [Candidatus Thiodiazotropha sp. (ex Notomyrtea botanica)]